jgi:CheY-like chemotaxis protein
MALPLLLIVEDNEDDLFLLKRAFERAHVANPIQSVRSGVELTKYLMGIGPYRDREQYALPGLIFLDLRLRDMQGTDVLRFLAEHQDLSRVHVVVWTAQIGPRDAVEVRELGIKCCVSKPHTPELLNQTVHGLNDFLNANGLPAMLEYNQRIPSHG